MMKNIPIGTRLAKILKLKRRYIDHEMKDLELSRTQWQTLVSLKFIGPCPQKDLLNYLDMDAPQLARILETLEKRNYILRTPIKNNRRSLWVEMTPHAKKHFIPRIDNVLDNENLLLLKGLKPEEKKLLERLLFILEKNMEIALNDQ